MREGPEMVLSNFLGPGDSEGWMTRKEAPSSSSHPKCAGKERGGGHGSPAQAEFWQAFPARERSCDQLEREREQQTQRCQERSRESGRRVSAGSGPAAQEAQSAAEQVSCPCPSSVCPKVFLPLLPRPTSVLGPGIAKTTSLSGLFLLTT